MEQMKDGPPPPYRIEDLTKLTGESEQVLRQAARAGRMPGAFKIGRDWLFPRQRTDRLLNGEDA